MTALSSQKWTNAAAKSSLPAGGRPSSPNRILVRWARCLVRKNMMACPVRKVRAHNANRHASLLAALAPCVE
jgi:hypothetical protein